MRQFIPDQSQLMHSAVWAPLACIATLALLAAPLRAEDEHQRATRAIGQLSHHSFSVRTRAERTLLKIGVPAEQALIDALTHTDPETRRSARRILEQILQDRLQQQIRQFTIHGPEATSAPIAGWQFYRDHVGDDPNARSDFVDAVLAEPVLIESLEQDPSYGSQALQSRTQSLYETLIRNPGRNPSASQGPGSSTVTSLASVSALLIVAAKDEIPLEDQTAQKIFQLMQHSGLTHRLTTDDFPSSRRLVGHFVRRSGGTPLAYQMLWLSMQCNLPEGLVPAEMIMKDNSPQPYVLQNAMLAIAKLGDLQHAALLEPYLENDNPVNKRRTDGFQPLLQDVALAATIHLHGKDPKKFGFSQLRPNSHTLFQPGTMGFENPQKRKAAFARWNQWKLQNQSSTDASQ